MTWHWIKNRLVCEMRLNSDNRIQVIDKWVWNRSKSKTSDSTRTRIPDPHTWALTLTHLSMTKDSTLDSICFELQPTAINYCLSMTPIWNWFDLSDILGIFGLDWEVRVRSLRLNMDNAKRIDYNAKRCSATAKCFPLLYRQLVYTFVSTATIHLQHTTIWNSLNQCDVWNSVWRIWCQVDGEELQRRACLSPLSLMLSRGDYVILACA